MQGKAEEYRAEATEREVATLPGWQTPPPPPPPPPMNPHDYRRPRLRTAGGK